MFKLKSFSQISICFIFMFIIINPFFAGDIGQSKIQAYYFSVPNEIVEVTFNTDGSADIEYWITFKVEGFGQDIDIIDIGFPNNHYKLSSITADIDGHLLTDIRVSEVINIGVEIHLHGYQITDTGTLHVKGNQPYMIFSDTEEPTMASCNFGNTWWDSEFTTGTTNLTTKLIFPETVSSITYTKYHAVEPTNTFYLANGRKVFEWHEPLASPSRQYKYGMSFPKDGVTWYDSVPPTDEELLVMFIIGGIVVILIFAAIMTARGRRRNRMLHEERLLDYVPPFVSVPTAGPRTDLSREMVAVILEKPIEITISMIILSLIEKGLVKPLSNDNPDPQIVEGTSLRALKKYEKIVVKKLRDDMSLDERDLIKAIDALVKLTQRRIRGYSYEKTVEYYKNLIEESVETISLKKSQDLENIATEAWYWAVLDEDYNPDFDVEITPGFEYIPWYHTYYYHSWYWVPSGRDFQRKVSRTSFPIRTSSRGRSSSRTRGSSTSRGCACACACAGCACACAGGGR